MSGKTAKLQDDQRDLTWELENRLLKKKDILMVWILEMILAISTSKNNIICYLLI